MTFFRLLHWKLKSGAKGIYFKETDVLEGQWATFNDVASTAAGGSCVVAEQLWYGRNPFRAQPLIPILQVQFANESIDDSSYQLL